MLRFIQDPKHPERHLVILDVSLSAHIELGYIYNDQGYVYVPYEKFHEADELIQIASTIKELNAGRKQDTQTFMGSAS